MAIGFGFNKAKVLASAEKFVQQGKLQNAIAEYEKITREDPKDLTVLNTIGDLYLRVGQNEHAAMYFKKVGEQYAQSGFNVKAIAIYKKLVKLQANNAEITSRLAELYAQQGLISDARAQYTQIAEALLRAGDNNQAARVMQRILELDPENAHMQARLAELYTKIGRRDEAHKIFFTAAEALHARGANDAAAEALGKMLTLDPNNPDALLLRGMIAADKGEHSSAAHYLEQVQNLDSRRDALRALLRAKLGIRDSEGAEAVANKLLTLHKDPNGVTDLVEWYLGSNQPQSALRLYEQNADRLLELGSDAAKNALIPLMNRVEQDPAALDTTRRLLEKTGDTSRSAELMEMQAHAAVQKGDYADARDLFRQLSELEPENAQHAQNYRQMLVKLGEDSASRILSPEEAAQAFMVEELVDNSPMVQQKYDPPTESAIEAALTDAELFVSYNVPSKAIPPLEAALPLAPQDITLNQRLATLYARAERWADAARMCENLSAIYQELGHATEAARYLEAARKYQLRAPGAAPSRTVAAAPRPKSIAPAKTEPPPPPPPPPAPMPVEEPSIQEFSFDVPDNLVTEPEASSVPQSLPVEAAPAPPAPEPQRLEVVPTHETEATEEPDHASEWESMLAVEHQAAPHGSAPHNEMEVVPQPLEPEPVSVVEEHEGGSSVCYAADEKVQEIQFYISQQMWDTAKKALLELQEIAPDAPQITELMAAISAGQAKPAAHKPAEAAFAPMELEPAAPDLLPPPFAAPAPHVAQTALREEFAIRESSADDVLDIAPPPATHRPVAAPVAPAAQLGANQSTEDILSDFVHGLEEAELKDFVPRVNVENEKANGATSAAGLQDAESASVLNDILSDLQEETAAADEADEDPETHYNLGIAFKEMGLLEEAIGELQKVCRAVDKGRGFSQPIQAYTWLAQCLVDKGAPEASVRWYQKALQLPGLDDSSRLAIYYDLAAAYEASGDKKAALANFMEVYGANIDFRDVAGRIKTLKS